MNLIPNYLRLVGSMLICSLFITHQAFANDQAEKFDFNTLPAHHLTNTIDMRFITSKHFTVIQWDLKKGAKLPAHSHHNEQVIRVLAGEVEVQSGDKQYNLHAGEVMVFPSYVTHGFTAINDAVIYEQQTPIREDFLQPGFIEKLSEYLKQNQ